MPQPAQNAALEAVMKNGCGIGVQDIYGMKEWLRWRRWLMACH